MIVVTATARHRHDPMRWVSLAIGIRERLAGEPFLEHDSNYACSIQAADSAAQSYTPSNWESGVVSGAGYAWRRWLGERQGVLLTRLEGVLGVDGIEGVADATAAALAALTHHDSLLSSNWDVQIDTDSRNGQLPTTDTVAATGA